MVKRLLAVAGSVLLLGGTLFSSAGVGAGGETAADQEPLAAGQLLAKFAAGGSLDGEVSRLLASGATASDALDALVQRLAGDLGMPLFVRQITAGREVLLEIERDRLLDSAAARLEVSPDVRRVQIERVAGTQRYWRDRLLLEPAPGSALARAAARVDAADVAQTLQRLLAEHLSQPYYAIVAQAVSADRVALSIDLQATTVNLVEALQARADVEYAQPNFVATIN